MVLVHYFILVGGIYHPLSLHFDKMFHVKQFFNQLIIKNLPPNTAENHFSQHFRDKQPTIMTFFPVSALV